MSAKDPALASRIERFKRGEVFDWQGGKISGADLSEAIRAAFQSETSPGMLTLQNAHVTGNVLLDTVGCDGLFPSFQAIGCHFAGGFRSGHSDWRRLSFIKSRVAFIQLPYARFVRDLSICETRCDGMCLLVGLDVAGGITLVKSHFNSGDGGSAINISESSIGRNIDARGITAKGMFLGCQIAVAKDVNLDGAHLSSSGKSDPRALDLSEAKIVEQLRMSGVGSDGFTCKGIIILESAEVGSVHLKSADLDGGGKPAIVADHIVVRRSVDMSGLKSSGGESFRCKGSIKLGSAEIRHQLQFVDCDIRAPEPAIVLQGARIGGDLVIGHPEYPQTTIEGGISMVGVSVGGGLRINNLRAIAKETAVGLRQAQVRGGIEVYDVEAEGAIRFDDTSSTSLDLIGVTIRRMSAEPTTKPPAEFFAAPEDNLLDFSFVELSSNVLVQGLKLIGGDCRFTGARIAGGVQMSAIDIDGSWLGVGAQNCRVGGGFMIAGSKENPSNIAGQVAMMGAEIGGDLTLADMKVGAPENPSSVVLREVTIKAGVTFMRCIVHGQLNASACGVGGDFLIHSSRLSAPGGIALDARGARIHGKLQLASVGSGDKIDCIVEGWLTADGADAGALSWYKLALGNDSALVVTNMQVARSIEAFQLQSDGDALVDVSGTEAPILDDRLDDLDGWGGETTSLRLEGFNYKLLAHPAGGFEETAASVRRVRREWLDRRADHRPTRAPRHLATVLRNQGLFEASRLVLIDAFRSEGAARQSPIVRAFISLFGITFGYGLSGRRAFLTLLGFWMLGTGVAMRLSDAGLLVSSAQPSSVECSNVADPSLFAADSMLPIIELGEESLCRAGTLRGVEYPPGIAMPGGGYRILGGEAVTTFGLALYKIVGWVLVSLAIATWSGLFRRAGRE